MQLLHITENLYLKLGICIKKEIKQSKYIFMILKVPIIILKYFAQSYIKIFTKKVFSQNAIIAYKSLHKKPFICN